MSLGNYSAIALMNITKNHFWPAICLTDQENAHTGVI